MLILLIFSNISKDFIKQECITSRYPHIVMQDNDMISLLQKAESPIQTDTVEGFIYEHDLYEREVNATMTSTFDPILQFWVPVCIYLLFWKSANDYRNHWRQVFSSYESPKWDEFIDIFPGNTSDFSDALRISFFLELKDLALKKWDVSLTDEDIIPVYRFCDVHFERSRRRVAQNHNIIPPSLTDTFIMKVKELCEIREAYFEDFKSKCRSLLSHFLR